MASAHNMTAKPCRTTTRQFQQQRIEPGHCIVQMNVPTRVCRAEKHTKAVNPGDQLTRGIPLRCPQYRCTVAYCDDTQRKGGSSQRRLTHSCTHLCVVALDVLPEGTDHDHGHQHGEEHHDHRRVGDAEPVDLVVHSPARVDVPPAPWKITAKKNGCKAQEATRGSTDSNPQMGYNRSLR